MACVCDLCKTEVTDSYDGRISHITQFHPLNLPAQMVAELASPLTNAFVDAITQTFKPKRRKRRDTKNRKRSFR